MLEGILGGGAGNIFNKSFRTFTINNTTLTGGKRGTKIIGLFADQKEMPTQGEMKDRADVYTMANGKDNYIEYVAVDAAYLKDMEFDIKTTVVRKTELNRDMEKAIMMEKVRVYKSFFPNLVNDNELFAQLIEKMGDDPTKMMKQDVVNQELGIQSEAPEDNQMADPGLSQNPEGDVMKNQMYKSMGNQVGIQNIKKLMG